jgi:sterol desaturase/sphingolipid hydroxylase (fatty acid hydroxylase superfamily)
MNGLFASPARLRLAVLAIMLGFMAFEYAVARWSRHAAHDWRESAASLAVALGRSLTRGAEALLAAAPAAYLYRHRLLDFAPTNALALVSLLLATEFAYYWDHRAAHRVRLLWATHAVHHSPTRLNLTAAIRLGWTGALSGGFLFFLPLFWLGFHPAAVAAMLGINLFYQFFIHTELVGSLGPLEWVLNTPAHHRVHHASNMACLDRNFGGILIVFDRLFGTFAAAPVDEALRYGLVGRAPRFNPVGIALGEWHVLLRDAWRVPGLGAKLRVLFGAPGVTVPTPDAVEAT